jgi:hypothetical protein
MAKKVSRIAPLLDECLDLVGVRLEKLVPALAGHFSILGAEGNSHPFGPSTHSADAVVRPPRTIVVPHMVIRPIALVGVEWKDLCPSFLLHLERQ